MMASRAGRLVLNSNSFVARVLSNQLSAYSKSPPLLCLKLPKLEEPRNFVLSSELKSLKDLQDVIKAEDSSVQSINAVNDEGNNSVKVSCLTLLGRQKAVCLPTSIQRFICSH